MAKVSENKIVVAKALCRAKAWNEDGTACEWQQGFVEKIAHPEELTDFCRQYGSVKKADEVSERIYDFSLSGDPYWIDEELWILKFADD